MRRSIPLLFLVAKASTVNAITVDLSTRYQKMDGFGFSQYFGTASTIQTLPADQQKQTLDLLFNVTTGAGLTILRNGISVDIIEPKSPGNATDNATYGWDGSDQGQVWLSQQALKYGVNRFYADSWSAPAFMKTNDNEDEGGYLCGVTSETCKTGDWRQAYANLIVQYLFDYRSEGINVTEVGFLNEPEYTGSYASMLSTGTQAASFIEVLYPTLQAAGLGDVGIVCCDAIGWSYAVEWTAQLIAAGVEPMLSRISSHWYSGVGNGPLNTSLPVWQTEYCALKGVYSDVWYSTGNSDLSEGLTWANLIYEGVAQSNLTAFMHWWGVNFDAASGSLISAGFGGPVQATSYLWSYAHWSRYVRPDAFRVAATSKVGTTVSYSAFHNVDGSVSVQIINNGATATPFDVSVTGMNVTDAQVWFTDNSYVGVYSMNGTVLSKNGTISLTAPTKSMVTVVFSPAS
ncbi:glycoside hydrolase [Mollisia scopiformis]|uniref:Glycoside hydrolase n=1 Tax=Mollisia scopiformis TaxID=149040 RepID=A0A132B7J0_MOLSC|nr:glycoside hydrolase [Mollisia scopiformis]KUJ08380.1 glycoside hydrolase [Mollisia scopiformis]